MNEPVIVKKLRRDFLTELTSYHTYSSQASDVSVFETTIRFLGGLLSAYAFSGDEVSI